MYIFVINRSEDGIFLRFATSAKALFEAINKTQYKPHTIEVYEHGDMEYNLPNLKKDISLYQKGDRLAQFYCMGDGCSLTINELSSDYGD